MRKTKKNGIKYLLSPKIFLSATQINWKQIAKQKNLFKICFKMGLENWCQTQIFFFQKLLQTSFEVPSWKLKKKSNFENTKWKHVPNRPFRVLEFWILGFKRWQNNARSLIAQWHGLVSFIKRTKAQIPTPPTIEL